MAGKPRAVVILSLALILPLLIAGNGWAQPFTVPLQSRTGPNEFDTADRGGQVGGQQVGRNYRLVNLRCNPGEAIVGLRIRRGDVLDFMQVGCAAPVCGSRGCQWSSLRWEMSAGNPNGGDPHPDMICNSNQMISGFRGREVSFTMFDYAADLEIRCSRMIGAPTAQGSFPVSQFGSVWHHPEGGLGLGYIPPNVVTNVNSAPITCPNGFGATALSTGEADFVNSRVVQAVSMFCPRGQPGPRCPDNLIVLATDDQYPLFQNRWFPRGGRTGGGAVIEMGVLPGSQNWNGTTVVENVQFQNSTCNINGFNPQNVCGMGQHQPFQIGAAVGIRLNNFMQLQWPEGGGRATNSFPDFHFVFDNNRGAPAGVNMIHGAPCTVVCSQNYTCGNRTYGPFTITYTFASDTFQRPDDVTRVTVTKH